MEDTVVTLECNVCCHSLAGLLWLRQLKEILPARMMEEGTKLETFVPSSTPPSFSHLLMSTTLPWLKLIRAPLNEKQSLNAKSSKQSGLCARITTSNTDVFSEEKAHQNREMVSRRAEQCVAHIFCAGTHVCCTASKKTMPCNDNVNGKHQFLQRMAWNAVHAAKDRYSTKSS